MEGGVSVLLGWWPLCFKLVFDGRWRFYFAVMVAAVLVVLTSGVIQKTGASVVLFTMMLAEVGSLVPCFTVMLPVPRLGAVRSESLLLTFFSKR